MAYAPNAEELWKVANTLRGHLSREAYTSMQVVTLCTIELGKCLHSTTQAIEDFSRSTTRLTWLTIILTGALVLAAGFSAVAALASTVAAYLSLAGQ